MAKRLSEDTIQQIITDYKSGMAPKDIGEKFGVYNNSVTRILRKRGIERNQAAPKISKEQEKYIIEKYQNGISSEKIGKELNINGSSVCRVLKRNGIQIRPSTENKRKYAINNDIFDDMNTEEMAYFYGFMLADGHVGNKEKSFKITLQIGDKDILQRFSYMFYNKDLTKIYDGYVTLYICSQDLTKKLINLGCPPNKTFVTEFPEWLEYKNYRHFLRGLIDGDGGIYFDSQRINLTGTNILLNKIAEILEEELEIYINVCPSHGGKKKSFYFEMTGQHKVHRFLKWLYKDATIYMERKHKESIKIIDYIAQNQNTNKPLDYGTSYIPTYNNIILTKDNICQLNDAQKESVAKFLFDYYREYGFPYPKYRYPTLNKDLRDLVNFNIDDLNTNECLSVNKDIGIKIFKHFSPHYFDVKSKKMPSMFFAFNSDSILMKVIKNRIGLTYKETFNMSGNMLRQGFRNSYSALAASIFKPTIAKYIYETYSEQNGMVFDCSMGFGQRLLGAISSKKNLTYIGCDPWKAAFEGINNIEQFLNDNKSIDYNTKQSRIVTENCCSSAFPIDSYRNMVDVAFSSPPYFDTEIYENDEKQAYFKEYDDFLYIWWEKTAQNMFEILKSNGVLALNLPDSDIQKDMLNVLKRIGFQESHRYALLMSRNNKYRARKQEHIIILKRL